MKQPYKPIACGFHDELLSLATLQKVSDVRYIENGVEKVVSDRIEDIFTKGNEEFLRTASGLIIRLDQLISVNGKLLPKKNVNNFTAEAQRTQSK